METGSTTLKITMDEDGIVTRVTDLSDKDVPCDPSDFTLVGRKLYSVIPEGEPGSCCWRVVGGVLKCRERYCKS